MPLPFLWIAGAITASVVGYAAKKMTEDDSSSSSRDDYSSYEEERRRQEKAERKARKAEKARKIELLEIDFASTGEKFSRDITYALQDLIFLHFENHGFSHTLRSGLQAGSDQQIFWAHKHLAPEVQTNLSFLGQNYSVNISPATQLKNFSEEIEASTTSINDLKHKKLALMKIKYQLKNTTN